MPTYHIAERQTRGATQQSDFQASRDSLSPGPYWSQNLERSRRYFLTLCGKEVSEHLITRIPSAGSSHSGTLCRACLAVAGVDPATIQDGEIFNTPRPSDLLSPEEKLRLLRGE